MRRRGESALTTLLLIGIMVAIAYFLFPQFFTWLPIGQSSVKAEMTVNFVDGTSKTYSGRLLAVAVPPSNVAISNIVFTVKATPTFGASSVTGVTWSGSGLIQVDGANKQTIGLSSGLPTTVSNGQVVTVSTTTITGSTLNGWIPFDYNNHTLHFTIDVAMDFTAPGEPPKEISGNAVSNLTLKNIGFPALLTVSVNTTVS